MEWEFNVTCLALSLYEQWIFLSVIGKIQLLSILIEYVVANHWIYSLLWFYSWLCYDYYVELGFSKVFIESQGLNGLANFKSIWWWKCITYSHTDANKIATNHLTHTYSLVILPPWLPMICMFLCRAVFTLCEYVCVACQSNALTPNAKTHQRIMSPTRKKHS